MKKFRFLLTSLLLVIVTSCSFITPNNSSSTLSSSFESSTTSSNISSSNSSTTVSSSIISSSSASSNENGKVEVFGSIPENVKVYTELEAIEYMKSSSWEQFEEMYVSGIIAESKYSSNNGKYRITLKNGFQIYQGYLDNGIPSLKVGDEIVAVGKSMIYQNDTYELAYDKSHGSYPIIIKVIRREIIINNDDSSFNDYGYPIIEVDIDDYKVVEIGLYNTKEEVAIYIYLFNHLPSNYKTKSQFNKSDYTKENKLSTGGDRFYNKEGRLPDISNIKYIEADIDYAGGGRNSKRIVYAIEPLLIFYTADHYYTFSIMKVIE